jgi:hypothetical protein
LWTAQKAPGKVYEALVIAVTIPIEIAHSRIPQNCSKKGQIVLGALDVGPAGKFCAPNRPGLATEGSVRVAPGNWREHYGGGAIAAPTTGEVAGGSPALVEHVVMDPLVPFPVGRIHDRVKLCIEVNHRIFVSCCPLAQDRERRIVLDEWIRRAPVARAGGAAPRLASELGKRVYHGVCVARAKTEVGRSF